MMTPQEKAKFEAMDREIARIKAYIGMDRQKAAEFELQDAMDHMARTQDPTLIKRHLQEQIAIQESQA